MSQMSPINEFFFSLPAIQGGSVESIEFYRVLNPSNSELKFIKKLHEPLKVSISLMVPGSGNPKLTASNCVPARDELRTFFFNNEDSAVTRIEEYNEKYGGGAVR